MARLEGWARMGEVVLALGALATVAGMAILGLMRLVGAA
jgi:hypothetical protein